MKRRGNPQSESSFLQLNDVRMHYSCAGRGPTILLLHGSGSSLQGFDALSDRLEQSFTIIRPDLPGFGQTGPRADRDYRVQTYASTMLLFMKALGQPEYAVLGNSLGGNIAWNMALDDPSSVNALILINATGYPEKSVPAGVRLARNPFLRPFLRWWLPRNATERSLRSLVSPTSTIVDKAFVDRVHGLMSKPGNRSAFVDFANTVQPDRSGQISEITAPTLVLRSASIDGQHFVRDIRTSRELVHPNGGHLLPEEDPVWVADAVANFLRTHARRKMSRGLSEQ